MPDGADLQFLALQERLAGRYSLVCELGRGGMGVVYLARDVRLDRSVALKLLPQALALESRLRERFLREARTAAKLSHPNIVPIYSVEENEEFVFFVMGYVEGRTLGERVRTRGPLSPSDAVRMLKEVGWALAYAHAQGVVHRDVKPDNILLEDGSGRAMIADFGIAGLMRERAGEGEIVGTAEFMSPEQASGMAVDARSDLYSLGVVGFYALSGKLPLHAESVPTTLELIRTEPAPRLGTLARAVPSKLGRAIDRCLAKDPEDRFASAERFAEAVDAVIGERRDIPVPVRRFINDPIDLPGDGPPYFLLAAVVAGFLMWGIQPWYTSWTPIVIYGTLAAASPFYLFARRARRMLASGHTLEDVEIAVRKQLEDTREELVYTFGDEPDGVEQWTRRVAYAFLGVTIVIGGAAIALFPMAAAPAALLKTVFSGSAAASLGASLYARERTKERNDEKGIRRLKFWRSRVGKFLVKLVGMGVTKPAAPLRATHRPTEMQISLAATALYERLPKNEQATLGDVPTILRELESDARRLWQAIDDLGEAEFAAVEAGQSLPEDLLHVKEAAEKGHAEAIAALETIRLSLLRMTAGSGSVSRLTTDLAAAGSVCDRISRQLEGIKEVDELLRASPVP